MKFTIETKKTKDEIIQILMQNTSKQKDRRKKVKERLEELLK